MFQQLTPGMGGCEDVKEIKERSKSGVRKTRAHRVALVNMRCNQNMCKYSSAFTYKRWA